MKDITVRDNCEGYGKVYWLALSSIGVTSSDTKAGAIKAAKAMRKQLDAAGYPTFSVTVEWRCR